ncbi:MAG: NUDIX hydrolase [Pseudotabrizicola sp.]|uniref:NUDIX hydrolase n=1 Tax=Pseudotabrizicola sp. TaxID=2939647 RepID=UPI00271EC929|nr:NUDIX hydrolase [Pseudotabrizicola sp.]MDO8881438.1 NUDIX hydrolase [Pseudotabrizicola sp.]MDP2083368.1 NUDIX hydrolase [Pseudotabrizicola sp.]MDZ7574906.1 NUDIX hydrolase [Pseudotabrizicola sp.]
MRRYGEPVKAGQKYRPRPGVYAVLLDGNRLLTTYQAEPIPEYQLPGGGIDPGEHPIPALHREVLEETGWKIEVTRKMGVYRRFTYMPDYDKWAEKICTIYLARPILRLGPPSEPGHSAIWMSAEHAVGQISNVGDRAFLAHALRSQPR